MPRNKQHLLQRHVDWQVNQQEFQAALGRLQQSLAEAFFFMPQWWRDEVSKRGQARELHAEGRLVQLEYVQEHLNKALPSEIGRWMEMGWI